MKAKNFVAELEKFKTEASKGKVGKFFKAIVSTQHFIKNGKVEETFKIAEMLLYDKNEYVQKAVGTWIREAGKKNEKRLVTFLEKYTSVLPRIILRYAVEKLDEKTKKHLMTQGESH